jgi:L-ascorbate metabolism protein UlaG (beta-lactamase superfamily)
MILILTFCSISQAQNQFESDTIKTAKGELVITFIGHGTLMFTFNNMVIHIDPVGRYADYSKMSKADLILVTHHHGDHLDKEVVNKILKDDTDLILTEICAERMGSGITMKNGDIKVVKGIEITAVPAYNLVHKRENGEPFHPKGIGNGYVITIGDKRVYIAGDTENFPEMKQLTEIDIAFLPMNLPYTMTPEMVADAVKMFNPKILYPYHFGNTDTDKLIKLLKDKQDCEIRVRKMN